MQLQNSLNILEFRRLKLRDKWTIVGQGSPLYRSFSKSVSSLESRSLAIEAKINA